MVATSAASAVRSTVTEALHFITELGSQHSSVFSDSVTIHETFTSQPSDAGKGTKVSFSGKMRDLTRMLIHQDQFTGSG